jgi:PhnB protein
MTNSHIPAKHSAVSPYLLVRDASALIAFLVDAFDGQELTRLERPDKSVMHGAIAIDGSVVMVGSRDQTFQNSIHLYVRNVDDTYHRCLTLGATSINEPTTFPYGDRSAGIRDPFGNAWWIGTHLGKAV